MPPERYRREDGVSLDLRFRAFLGINEGEDFDAPRLVTQFHLKVVGFPAALTSCEVPTRTLSRSTIRYRHLGYFWISQARKVISIAQTNFYVFQLHMLPVCVYPGIMCSRATMKCIPSEHHWICRITLIIKMGSQVRGETKDEREVCEAVKCTRSQSITISPFARACLCLRLHTLSFLRLSMKRLSLA